MWQFSQIFPFVLCVLCVCVRVCPSANYSCSPLRGRPNLHLSKQRGRRRHTASGSGQPITKNRLTLSLPAYEHAVTYGRPLNLKMINLRCQTKYSVRFLPLCWELICMSEQILVGRTSCVRVPPTGFTILEWIGRCVCQVKRPERLPIKQILTNW